MNDTDDEAYAKLQTAYNAAKGTDWPDFPAKSDITFASDTGTVNVGNAVDDNPTYDLKLKKETVGNVSETFKFVVALEDENNDSLDPAPTFDDSRIEWVNTSTYKVTNMDGPGEVVFNDLPKGTMWLITESRQSEWTLISVDGNKDASVSIGSLNADTTVTFLNATSKIDISGTKTWVDGNMEHDNAQEITLTLKRSINNLRDTINDRCRFVRWCTGGTDGAYTHVLNCHNSMVHNYDSLVQCIADLDIEQLVQYGQAVSYLSRLSDHLDSFVDSRNKCVELIKKSKTILK